MDVPSGTDRAVTSPAPRLALDGISRSYGPVLALDAASLHVAAGEVHALLGENGAGKSTLMKVAFGLERPDAGTIAIDGLPVTFRSPRDAIARGIGMVQQHFSLVGAMSVAENVALGGAGQLHLGVTRAAIARIGRDAGLALNPDALVRDLPVGAQQRLEIVRALSRDARTLILDEPTAVLAPREAQELLAWTRRFADGGGTVILIAHKLREVLSIADRVTVLRRGTTVLTARASDVDEARLAAAMLGESRVPIELRAASNARRVGAPVIELSGVSVTSAAGVKKLADVTLTVHAGEMVGIAAVEGAGQHELLRVLAGRLTHTSGVVRLPPTIGFVPEDRHRDAVVLDATLAENVALRGANARSGRMDWRAIRTETDAIVRARDVRADGASTVMRTLSGGNQQKLVIGRELAGGPAALVVENPTRGLDIRATSDVHAALRSARDSGTAVVVYCSDLDEVLALADRTLVVSAARAKEVVPDRELVGKAMLQGVS